MAQITIDGLDERLVSQLEAQAARNGRSLEQEVHSLLESSVTHTVEQTRDLIDAWRDRLGGRQFSDSVELLREDRDR